ncbi:MAG TPA: tripartite tricarboxylate transporter substrate-binding protein, partial [Xanthobacteraceae bacterium]|nr:tripartite tricarboxylate transporter substrate-binding protein [Xanthobacteraceae bacterium]
MVRSLAGRVRPHLLVAALTAASAVATSHGFAQTKDAAADFPNHAVRIIVSAPPGGGVDIAARYIADKLQTRWGQPVVVENRPGAGGNIG